MGIAGDVVVSAAVWSAMVTVPAVLTAGDLYTYVFPDVWLEWSPLGLCLGLFAVVVSQLAVIAYHWARHSSRLTAPDSHHVDVPQYSFREGVLSHVLQPEGILLLGTYLTLTWIGGVMPPSYYSFQGGIEWGLVLSQLLCTDLVQTALHLVEHKASMSLYRASHKPHHRFVNPRLFDAFNGSVTDTVLMILIPLVITAQMIHANVWSYMTFGALYSGWLTLIHSEWPHPWEPLFRRVGFGTSADHHVHHAAFVYNYGHIFMYWDKLAGTYRPLTDLKRPQEAPTPRPHERITSNPRRA
eukprot:Sspe_Gene.51268::Locus_28478_Transcript_1_1_Confidence_1.000_Length_1097::g.51268::m.51268/K00227/SC5DL, ERG3; Delta7-sterol 5-desaturase